MGKNLQRLTTDYEGLLKRYSMEKNFIQKRNSTGVTTFPVIQDAWLFDKNVEIEIAQEVSTNFQALLSITLMNYSKALAQPKYTTV